MEDNKSCSSTSYDEQKRLILEVFNNTNADYDKNIAIHELFEMQVEKNPKDIAAFFGEDSLTYEELNNKANCIADILISKGVRRNTIVGILVERSLEMIIGIYGILKAGGAYLPICPTNPEKRIEYILGYSNVGILLTQDKFKDMVKINGEIISLDDKNNYKAACSNPKVVSKSQDMVYVIFTSGTTGNPKGTMISHRSLVNRLNWMQKKYPLNREDVLLQKTPFEFDVSVWEIFWWSIVGARLCLLKPGHEKFPQTIVDVVEKKHISVIHFVPSMLYVFLRYIENSDEVSKLSSLKRVFCSGEALTVSHVKMFNSTLYKVNSTLLTNLYGPTEATIDVSYYDCPTNDDFYKIPIGKPIDNIKLLIIDNDKLQPIGQDGEICISGDGLAIGYLYNEELTRRKFVDNPFVQGEKIYKTGDIGRWLPDGNIEYIGRLDHQIKIRGMRIELEEIEQKIIEFKPDIECVVIAQKLSDTIVNIKAYLVSKEKIDIEELKGYLKELLPVHMIPNTFIELEHMPLSPNGKIDRKKLLDSYL
ncbi:MAG: non-ribosomal peptide synthetase [Caulobacteraceae bacterium]